MVYVVETFTHRVEVCCTTECWIGVQVLCVVPKVWIVYETFFVNQVFLVEYEVKASQCWEDTDIWICNRIAHQVTLLAKAFFKPVQASKDTIVVVLVIFLVCYESCQVYRQVEVSVDDNVQRIDIGT